MRADGRAYVDLDGGECATNKRQPPVPIPPRLLAHMRSWARLGAGGHFVEWHGKPVRSVKTGSPERRHSPAFLVLRHTRSVTRRRPGSCSAAFQFGKQRGSSACRRKCLPRLMDTIIPITFATRPT